MNFFVSLPIIYPIWLPDHKEFVTVQVSTIHLNNRSNSYNQSFEKLNGTAEHCGKIKTLFFEE